MTPAPVSCWCVGQSDVVTFVNGSFDQGNLPASGFVTVNSSNAWSRLPGWTVVSGSVDLDPAGTLDLTGEARGTISQTLDTSAEVGSTVRFSITVMDNPSTTNATGFYLTINGQPVVPDDATGAASVNPVNGLVILPNNTVVTTFEYSFTATGADTVQIQSYSVHSYRGAYLYSVETICLARGTMIATPEGPVPIENITPGMAVLTLDHGAQVVRWIGRSRFTPGQLRTRPQLRPIRIAAGALGAGLPSRDLLVSRQHRMLIASPIARRLTGHAQLLVPAVKLTGLPGITVDPPDAGVDYFHLLFDRHEVILAEGAPTESLHRGPMALRALGPTALREIQAALGPDAWPAVPPPLARPVPEGALQRRLLARHRDRGMPVLAGWDAAALPMQACG